MTFTATHVRASACLIHLLLCRPSITINVITVICHRRGAHRDTCVALDVPPLDVFGRGHPRLTTCWVPGVTVPARPRARAAARALACSSFSAASAARAPAQQTPPVSGPSDGITSGESWSGLWRFASPAACVTAASSNRKPGSNTHEDEVALGVASCPLQRNSINTSASPCEQQR